MSDLFKKPDLTYEKDYSTEGHLVQPEVDENYFTDGSQDYNDQIKDIKDSLKSLKETMAFIPKEIADAVEIPVSGVQYMIGTVNPEDLEESGIDISITVKDEPVRTEDDSNIIIDDGDDMDLELFPKIKPVDVKSPKTSKVERIRENYAKNIVAIIGDYVSKLEKTIGNHVTNTLSMIGQVDKSVLSELVKPYEGDANGITNKDYKHLSDLLVRSQVVRDQKIRLYRKLFDIDQTIMHIRACKTAFKLRERYYEADYGVNQGLTDINSNMFLAESRALYDKKYEENLYNLYKYLNSSVILISECLAMSTKEIQAKAVLYNKKLIKSEGTDNK